MVVTENAVKFFASILNQDPEITIGRLQGHLGQASDSIRKYVNSYGTFYEFLKAHNNFFKINFEEDYTCSLVNLLTEKLKEVGFLLPENIDVLKQHMTSNDKLKLGSGIEGIHAFLTIHFLTFRVFRNNIIGLRSVLDKRIINSFVTLLLEKNMLKLDCFIGYFSHFPFDQRNWLGGNKIAIENYIADNINVFNYSNNIISLKSILFSEKQISSTTKTQLLLATPSLSSGNLTTSKGKETILMTCENNASTCKKKKRGGKKRLRVVKNSSVFAKQISSPTKTMPSLEFRPSYLNTSKERETNLMACENNASTCKKKELLPLEIISYVGRVSLLSPSYGFIKNGVDSKNVLFTVDVCYCSQKKINNLFEFYKDDDEVGFYAKILTGNETYKYQATLVWKGKKPTDKNFHSSSFITSDQSLGSCITQKEHIKSELQTETKNSYLINIENLVISKPDQSPRILADDELQKFSLQNPFLVDNKFQTVDVPKFSSNEQNYEVKTDSKVKMKEVSCQTVSTGEILSFKLII